MSTNNITGDRITTGEVTDLYRLNYDNIFKACYHVWEQTGFEEREGDHKLYVCTVCKREEWR